NPAADEIPRHHAVVNADSGAPAANRAVRVPESSSRDSWDRLQRELWHKRSPDLPPPRLFDGDAVPVLDERTTVDGDAPIAVVGQAVDVLARAAWLGLGRVPGRNLAVLGTRAAEACAVLGAAARSLARCGGRFSVAYLDDDAAAQAGDLWRWLPAGTRFY